MYRFDVNNIFVSISGLIEILLIAAYAGGPILIVIILVTIMIYCYRRHKVRKHKILKTSSQEQPLTSQSLSSQLRSLEHSPSARRSNVMHSTSFITGRISDDEDFPLKCNDKDHMETKAEVNDIPTYKTHQKRASYHLMKELCYEDGSVIIAQI